ncbi:hypothetical protein V6N13_117323 [Hibiscus sabdariffa]|uniref:Uncharacterized protein n=1 Tax=Hibiscus sabdariffa TaxID=183260 RepID=A0ABR2PAY5_9ROSI
MVGFRQWRLRQETKLTRRVSEKANLTLAVLAIFASFGSVTCRVEPAFEHPVSELAVVTARASASAAEVRADGGGIPVPSRVTAAGFLAGMSKGTVGPIVAPAPSASPHLELVHAEMVAAVGIIVAFMDFVVGREVVMEVHGGVVVDVVEGHLQGEMVARRVTSDAHGERERDILANVEVRDR